VVLKDFARNQMGFERKKSKAPKNRVPASKERGEKKRAHPRMDKNGKTGARQKIKEAANSPGEAARQNFEP